MALQLDHLAVVAPDLEQGCAYIQDLLGVTMGPGGEHVTMGTHNRLLKLGPSVYLEVIAPAPHLPVPDHPRWFGLDGVTAPHLATWIVRTPDLAALAAAATPQLGRLQTLRRDALTWKMALTDDGKLLEDGCLPLVIEWPTGRHPAEGMPDSGCKVDEVKVTHPKPETLSVLLPGLDQCLGVSFKAGPAKLSAVVTNPKGQTVTLTSA